MNQTYIWLISLVAAFGGLLFGFDIAIFSGTIPFIQPHFNLDAAGLGWVGSSLYVGCMFGALATGWLTDRFGRKKPLILSALIFALSSLMMGLAASEGELVLWRIVAGFGVGAASMLSPLYIAEVSPPAIRGKMVSINQLAIVIGILLAYLSNYFLAGWDNNWRWMFASGALPSVLFFFFVFLVPESPRWLLAHGKEGQARNVLAKLLGPAAIEQEVQAVRSSLFQTLVKARFADLIKEGIRFIVFLGIGIAVFQQISGANAVFFYAPVIFEQAGMQVNDQLFQQILIGIINLLFTLLAMQLVDKAGRKKMMLAGSSLMALFLLLIAACFHFNLFEGYWLTLVVLAFIATYATTLAPVTWVLISEIFPNGVRGMAVSVATFALWTACFALAYAFPVLIEVLAPVQTFLLFAGICFIYFLFLWRYVPETKGKTLEEIEAAFGKQ
ncbi:SP family arabinose:H+ symporter-like MFS transporter [Anseongella ginsenosidimutans]|uniref:SP family arabinose:H+ symporter-like MFS transporter n=1 Tax=Anseongella ginsenosidimutans TaxID=496056 RepID=A0A4R3KN32_9SPHI|nr:sugar porter family MFS transporter [Anseongella ginsenosidimutans]QEC52419.1 sugar porter family MFS transporter [Anseongella ginsenosidimutans]TCS85837.1 SP family arabinose:H+ symporter-like MFS transporter [Anseongella ginsenosidimutans]